MKLVIVSVGTRGDVQPYIAVARALMARGHEVTFAVSDEHAPLLRTYGVAHRPMRGSVRALLETDLGRAWLASADSPRKYARYGNELFLPMQRALCEDADAAVEGADGVVFYAMAMHAMHAAERRKLPMVAVAPWPIAPSREVPPVLAPFLSRAPGFVKSAASHWSARVAFAGFNGVHLDYRRSVGLPSWRAKDTLHAVLDAGIPTVHLFSEAVIRRPADWAPQHAVAGYAFAPRRAYEPPRALADFLASGPAPVYIGFGSMTGFEPEKLATLTTSAARLAGVRAVVATGWAGLALTSSDDVYALDELPHEWLFPRVAAVVHHGGAGTFAEGLRAGRPTVISAFFADQPFWGHLNERLGTGPRALRRSSLTAEKLASAIRLALDGPHRTAAESLGERLRSEDGAARAAELIEAAMTTGGAPRRALAQSP